MLWCWRWRCRAGVLSCDMGGGCLQALERSLREYNKTLEERASMVDEVESLRNQNQELKNVLNHYLNAQVNDELHVPPTQVIRIEPAAGASVTR